jgi:hypothetical protein
MEFRSKGFLFDRGVVHVVGRHVLSARLKRQHPAEAALTKLDGGCGSEERMKDRLALGP